MKKEIQRFEFEAKIHGAEIGKSSGHKPGGFSGFRTYESDGVKRTRIMADELDEDGERELIARFGGVFSG